MRPDTLTQRSLQRPLRSKSAPEVPEVPELVTLRLELLASLRGRARAEQALKETQAALLATQDALADSRAREMSLQQLAERDALTGLPNRLSFGEHSRHTLSRHAAQSRAFCLLFIDLDGFKAVNNDHGHAAGDALLKVVGARLVHTLRSDDHVSRHGGDEFVCLLPHVQTPAHALQLAHKLMQAVAAPCRVGAHTVHVSASVGIALYPGDGQTVDDLLARADQAMRWAKAVNASPALGSQVPHGQVSAPG